MKLLFVTKGDDEGNLAKNSQRKRKFHANSRLLRVISRYEKGKKKKRRRRSWNNSLPGSRYNGSSAAPCYAREFSFHSWITALEPRIFFHESCSTVACLPPETSLTMSFFIREFNYHPSVGKCRTIGCAVAPSGNILNIFNTNGSICSLVFSIFENDSNGRIFLENRCGSFFLERIFIFSKNNKIPLLELVWSE